MKLGEDDLLVKTETTFSKTDWFQFYNSTFIENMQSSTFIHDFFTFVLFCSLISRLMLAIWALLKVVLEPTSKL